MASKTIYQDFQLWNGAGYHLNMSEVCDTSSDSIPKLNRKKKYL